MSSMSETVLLSYLVSFCERLRGFGRNCDERKCGGLVGGTHVPLIMQVVVYPGFHVALEDCLQLCKRAKEVYWFSLDEL